MTAAVILIVLCALLGAAVVGFVLGLVAGRQSAADELEASAGLIESLNGKCEAQDSLIETLKSSTEQAHQITEAALKRSRAVLATPKQFERLN